ncbi:MAG: cyclic nucleotide-binding domain-containing protein [Cyclobacteriaceae bacterium]|nr:cyclic nucleotide-binding domain-containing protein [Cyclobacteriaceae bacterium]
MFKRKRDNNILGHLYQDGEIIIKQGTVGDCLYVIQQGKVEVVRESDKKEIIIAELGEKEFFGEMALFEKDVRSCTVRAKGDTKVLTLDKKGLYKTIQKDPSLAFRLLEKMSNRLREVDKKITY